MLFGSKFGYHKLPGGGMEDNENALEALEREVKEIKVLGVKDSSIFDVIP
jgi:ADP-ribose pyrophosphatase YjhB (NUDIX family)